MAYIDPPYLGCGRHYDHPRARSADDVRWHKALIAQMCGEFPDGWALSLSSSSLQRILPLCPRDVRVAAWVKPFCAWKKGINPVYGWEPVIFRGGRKRGLESKAVRDWVSTNIAMRTGLIGSKPREFCYWLFDLLGLRPTDTLVDVFPGTRAVTRAWKVYKREATKNQ